MGSRIMGSGGSSDNPLGGFSLDCVCRTYCVVRCAAFGRIAYDVSDSCPGGGGTGL